MGKHTLALGLIGQRPVVIQGVFSDDASLIVTVWR